MISHKSNLPGSPYALWPPVCLQQFSAWARGLKIFSDFGFFQFFGEGWDFEFHNHIYLSDVQQIAEWSMNDWRQAPAGIERVEDEDVGREDGRDNQDQGEEKDKGHISRNSTQGGIWRVMKFLSFETGETVYIGWYDVDVETLDVSWRALVRWLWQCDAHRTK